MADETINKDNTEKNWQDVAYFMRLCWITGDDYVAPSAQ